MLRRTKQTFNVLLLHTNKRMLGIPFITLRQTLEHKQHVFMRQDSILFVRALKLKGTSLSRSETFRVNSDDEKAAVDQVCVCGGLQMIVQSFISSNPVSFRSCTLRLHKNRNRSCELPQPIDPAPQTWIALLWGSPASQTGFNHAWSPNHGNLIYLKPLAVLLEPLYSLF